MWTRRSIHDYEHGSSHIKVNEVQNHSANYMVLGCFFWLADIL